MSIYQESGLQITLPDTERFRFQDCSGYKTLNGKNLSEMDFGWWDSTKNSLWLLDVKDYSHLTPTERLPDYLLENLVNKATDSLLILSAVWFGSVKGQEICSELPLSCRTFPSKPKKLKISSRTKENGTVLSFVNHPQTLTVPCSLFPVP
ncbi:MAG: hypothetical protein RIE73_05425 [Coleofasciculus sp. C1-SOL-03]|uniref:hypothetical protein n=1 Tax=Coleofasciculus sp. C1-SOL-03 TaxID=3069522 RepID=UPI0032F2AF35